MNVLKNTPAKTLLDSWLATSFAYKQKLDWKKDLRRFGLPNLADKGQALYLAMYAQVKEHKGMRTNIQLILDFINTEFDYNWSIPQNMVYYYDLKKIREDKIKELFKI